MSALREILDLPPEVKKSDFVVKLTDGISHPEALLRDYAITPSLHAAFDTALTLAGAALRDRQSHATYIHGSFGSGKSHFMATLSLMLRNHPVPWSDPSLHDLLAKHPFINEARLLQLHFHMVGAQSLDEKVFSEYLRLVRELHPDAPIAPLFEDHRLFDNAHDLRRDMGDEPFFAKLNAGQKAPKGWGKLGQTALWDPARFDEARQSPDPEVRGRLFSVLVKTHFPAFAERTSGFVDFDRGLGILSRHASTLGYQGVVLFFDELILWLASIASDRTRLNSEVQKMAKLVEAQDQRRDAPLISFAARQRDIAEMVGDVYAGVDAQNLRDSLRWFEGRFGLIKLEDRNLPAIVRKRVVRPKSKEAAQQLDDAFTQMRRTLGTSWATLLGSQGDETAFRQVYPFSPALLEVLVAMSHYLQRERTALKILMELLVGHLQDFEIGRVVPTGDLFDVMAGGEEPMDGAMRALFASAKRIYQNELLPLIQAQNETATSTRCQRLRDDHPVALGCSNCPEVRCRADNRLAKTLLLAALIPQTQVLKGLTASRLVQLNHGTLRSPVPGSEASMAVSRLRSWASQLSSVRMDDRAPGDPTVWVDLESLDLKPILDAAHGYDSPGARRRKLQEILYTALGVPRPEVSVEHEVLWRNTRRAGRLVFENVREVRDDALLRAGHGEEFKVVIDYPFDEQGQGPQQDEGRIESYLEKGAPTSTVVWLPSFFGDKQQRELGELVVIDKILEGESWRSHLQNLRPEDQQRARTQLQSLSTQKRQALLRALDAAYGLKKVTEADQLDPARTIERHFFVLDRSKEIRSTLEATLDKALYAVICQLLDQKYPRHPIFSDRVTRGKLDKNLALFRRICEAPEGSQRLALDRTELRELDVARELGIVTLHETSAALRPLRFQELDNALRADGVTTPTVSRVKSLLDPSGVMGLTPEVMDFLVLAYALYAGREVLRGGSPLRDPTMGKLPGDAELFRPALPDQVSWQKALDRAAVLFGIALSGKALRAENLRQLSQKLDEERKKAAESRSGEIEVLLHMRAKFFEGEPARLKTAMKVTELLDQLDTKDPVAQVTALSSLDPVASGTSETAMRDHILRAKGVAECLENDLIFQSFDALATRSEPAAKQVLDDVRQALEADELRDKLAKHLTELALRAQRLFHPAPGTAPPAGQPPPTDVPGPGPVLAPVEPKDRTAPQEEIVAHGICEDPARLDEEWQRLKQALLSAGDDARLSVNWRVMRAKR